jgi:hypothetical protein
MENIDFICILPDGLEKVIINLFSKNWLIAPFDTEEVNFYRPANYLVNKEKNNIQYTLIIDRNIFSYVVSAYRKEKINEQHRYAISLVTFCQFSEIEIDVGLPIYEKVNYDKNNLTEAIVELDLFFRIDDTPDTDSLIDFALGYQDYINVNSEKDVSDRINSIVSWYDKYEKLKNWDSMYLITMKITELEFRNISCFDKFKQFMDWQYKEYRFSMVGTIYALIIFSSRRIKGMMKFKIKENKTIKKKQLYNMTWDLFFMDFYSKKLVDKKNNEEFLIATDDKVVKYLLQIIMRTNMSGNISTLKDYLSEKDYPMFDYYLATHKRNDEREFRGKYFKKDDHRENLIKSYESILLI